MSAPKWSTGPYEVRDRSEYRISASDPRWEIGQESDQEPCWVAPCWVALAINEDDARLLAAAPDLYAAAQLVDLMFARKNHSTADADWLGDDEHEAWSAICKAMRKARGITASRSK